MPTVGFIYPDHAAEDDYPLAERMLGGDVRLAVEHIYGTDLHAVDELLDLGSPRRLAHGAALLAHHEPDAVVWACTSGSFVFGSQGAAEQVHNLSAAAGGLPTSSTSFAFVRAARSLEIARVAVVASYPHDVATLFVDFLATNGIDVLAMSSADIDTAAEVGEMLPDSVVELALRHDRPEADALLIPDTAMRTLGLITTLEQRLGKPVLTANQVTIWEGLRLCGLRLACDGFGALGRAPAVAAPERGA